jgi:hypothetical protein
MHVGRCVMHAEDAPPGFWSGAESQTLDGVELTSKARTRFFQTLDPYPREWGRLVWRVQVNKLEAERATLPMFRTFYPGVEWNLKVPDYRWFLTAWLKWDGPGPPSARAIVPVPKLEGDTVLFDIGAGTDARPLFLRSRVDAREQRRIAPEAPSKPQSSIISIDDVIERRE